MARIFQIKRGPKARLPVLAQGELAMTTDSGAEALWLGTGAANKKIPVNPTAADVGAVAKTGDTMTGNLSIDTGSGSVTQLISYDKRVFLRNLLDSNNFQELKFGADQFLFGGRNAGVNFTHAVHHAGSKPTGSYTGNGSAAARTIETGGIGSTAVLYNNAGLLITTPYGGFGYRFGNSNIESAGVYFSNGKITIATASDLVNANGATYQYQVL